MFIGGIAGVGGIIIVSVSADVGDRRRLWAALAGSVVVGGVLAGSMFIGGIAGVGGIIIVSVSYLSFFNSSIIPAVVSLLSIV